MSRLTLSDENEGQTQHPCSPDADPWDADYYAPGQSDSDVKPFEAKAGAGLTTAPGVRVSFSLPLLESTQQLLTGPLAPLRPLTPRSPLTRGATGLENIGNTCYLNSALQCILSIPQLCHFFLDNNGGYRGLYEASAEEDAVISATQSGDNDTDNNNSTHPAEPHSKKLSAITFQLCALMSKIWSGSHAVLNPQGLHTAIGDANSQFKALLHHDSQELLMFLLDGIHEDLSHQMTRPRPLLTQPLRRDLEPKSVAEPTPSSACGDVDRDSHPAAQSSASARIEAQLSSSSSSSEGVAMPSESSPPPRHIQAQPGSVTVLSSPDEDVPSMKAHHRSSPRHDSDDALPYKVPCIGTGAFPDFSESSAASRDRDGEQCAVPKDADGQLMAGPSYDTALLSPASTNFSSDSVIDIPSPSEAEATSSSEGGPASTVPPANTRTVISKTFQGEYRSEIVCSKCRKSSVRKEPFLCLSVPLPGATERQLVVTFVPFLGIRCRYLLTLHKQSNMGDVKKALCEKFPERQVDTHRLVAAHPSYYGFPSLAPDTHKISDVSGEVIIFENNSPLGIDAAVEEKDLASLIPGSQLGAQSALWRFPLDKEVAKKMFASSDTDSGYTQGSGFYSLEADKHDFHGQSGTGSVDSNYSCHTTPVESTASSSCGAGAAQPAVSFLATDPATAATQSDDVQSMSASLASGDSTLTIGDTVDSSSVSTSSSSWQEGAKSTPVHTADSGVASRGSVLSGEITCTPSGGIEKGVREYFEAVPSPQSTVSSEDSLTCRSEVSCDSLSSTTQAFATKLGGPLVSSPGISSAVGQSPSSLCLEQTIPEHVASTSSEADGSASSVTCVDLSPSVTSCAVYDTELEEQSSHDGGGGGGGSSAGQLDYEADHFSEGMEDLPPSGLDLHGDSGLSVTGFGLGMSVVRTALSRPSSDVVAQASSESVPMDTSQPDEVIASHGSCESDVSQIQAPPFMQEMSQLAGQPTTDDGAPCLSCPICMEEKRRSELLVHKNCTAQVTCCLDCRNRSVEENSPSFPCADCKKTVDFNTDLQSLPDSSVKPVLRDLRLHVLVRHREYPNSPLPHQFHRIGDTFIMDVSSQCNASDLYARISEKLAPEWTTPPSGMPVPYALSTDALTSRNAIHSGHFAISVVHEITLQCNRCSSPCPGCVLPRTGVIQLRNSDILAVTFGITLHVNFVKMLKHVDDDFSMQDQKLDNSIPLSKCLEEFAKEEVLGGEDPFDCPHCKSKEEAVKRITVSKFPPVLLVQLKRFACDSLYAGEKLDNPVLFALSEVDFSELLYQGRSSESSALSTLTPSPPSSDSLPLLVDVSSTESDTGYGDHGDDAMMDVSGPAGSCTAVYRYGSDSSSGEPALQHDDDSDDTVPMYDLTGFICHSGSLRCGHYTACVRHPVDELWYHYNDTSVSQRDPLPEDQSKAYVLVYSKRGGELASCIPVPEWSHGLAALESPPPLQPIVPDATRPLVDYRQQAETTTTRELQEVAKRLGEGSTRRTPQQQAERDELLGSKRDSTPPMTLSPMNTSPTQGSVNLVDGTESSPQADGSLREYSNTPMPTASSSTATHREFMPGALGNLNSYGADYVGYGTMTEDEQLRRAIEESLKDTGVGSVDNVTTEDTQQLHTADTSSSFCQRGSPLVPSSYEVWPNQLISESPWRIDTDSRSASSSALTSSEIDSGLSQTGWPGMERSSRGCGADPDATFDPVEMDFLASPEAMSCLYCSNPIANLEVHLTECDVYCKFAAPDTVTSSSAVPVAGTTSPVTSPAASPLDDAGGGSSDGALVTTTTTATTLTVAPNSLVTASADSASGDAGSVECTSTTITATTTTTAAQLTPLTSVSSTTDTISADNSGL